MNSLDPEYKSGYSDGYRFGFDVGMERGLEQALQAHVAALCDLIAAHPWMWHQGDGYGGWVKAELESAFDFWEFPKPPKPEAGNRAKRKPLRSSEIIAAMKKSDSRCVACGTSDDLQVDHILPVSRGGTNDVDNLQMLCQPCNSSKRDKTMDEWNGGAE